MGASIVVQVPQDMLFTGDQVKALLKGSAVKLCNKTKVAEEDESTRGSDASDMNGMIRSSRGSDASDTNGMIRSSRDVESSRDSKLVISVAIIVKQK